MKSQNLVTPEGPASPPPFGTNRICGRAGDRSCHHMFIRLLPHIGRRMPALLPAPFPHFCRDRHRSSVPLRRFCSPFIGFILYKLQQLSDVQTTFAVIRLCLLLRRREDGDVSEFMRSAAAADENGRLAENTAATAHNINPPNRLRRTCGNRSMKVSGKRTVNRRSAK